MVHVHVIQLHEAASAELAVTNDSDETLWNVDVPVDDILLSIFRLDDTHMAPETKLPAVRINRLDAGATVRSHQRWDLTSSKQLAGACWMLFSKDELGTLVRHERASFSVTLNSAATP
jgi:hypothetical protein